MKALGIIVLVVIVVALIYVGYKFVSKPADGSACSTTGGTVNDGTIINGNCVSTQLSSNGSQQLNASNYYVNGDPSHDKAVFSRGLDCAKAFLYKNTSDPMSNNILTTLAYSGRNGGDNTACQTIGIDCSLLNKISMLNQQDTGSILNYISNLSVDSNWKQFANVAAGKKNMCSVILAQALKESLPYVYATLGRG